MIQYRYAYLCRTYFDKVQHILNTLNIFLSYTKLHKSIALLISVDNNEIIIYFYVLYCNSNLYNIYMI